MVMGAGGVVAGYVLMNDLSVPHTSFFRPPVKFKCLDGFLGVGSQVPAAGQPWMPPRFRLEVRINGALVQIARLQPAGAARRQLLADVGEFMTLRTGDVLMLGCDVLADGRRPLAKAGDRIDIRVPGLGTLSNTLMAEAHEARSHPAIGVTSTTPPSMTASCCWPMARWSRPTP